MLEAAKALRVPQSLWLVDSSHSISQRSFSSFLGTGLFGGRRLPSTRPIKGNPYLVDSSLMMALTGRIEFRSFLCCSIRNDCTVNKGMRSRRIMNISWLAHSSLGKGRKYEGSTVIRTGMYLSKLSFNAIKLDLLMDCPGHVISLKWLWNTRKLLYCNMNTGTFLTFTFMLCPLKCLPSTHMYLFLHSWELFLGRALASRTEITCLSHLPKQMQENDLVLIRLQINPVTKVVKDDTWDSSTPNDAKGIF